MYNNDGMTHREIAQARLKKQIKLGVAAFAAFIVFMTAWSSFYSVTVQPGEELVVIDNPYFFGSQGMRPESLKEGRHWLWKTSSVKPVVVRPQLWKVVFDDLATKDKSMLDFESTVQLQIYDAPSVYKLGDKWFDVNVLSQYGNIVRAAVKGNDMSSVIADPVVSVSLDNEITKNLEQHLKDNNIKVRVVAVSLGRAKANPNVQEEIDRTAIQQQRTRTMDEMRQAEISRKEAETERAAADNAYRNAMNLDTAQFVQLEQNKASIEVARLYSAACQKAGNCIVTSGAGAAPLVQTK